MHQVCNIRDPELRTGKSPREEWAGYVRDLMSMMDAALGGSSLDRDDRRPQARAA
jgi:hypothetical protein